MRPNAPYLYLKNVTVGSDSAVYRPLRIGGSGSNAGIRVTPGADGGSIAIQVNDKDGKPVPFSHVVILPAGVDSEAEAAVRMVLQETDQSGACSYDPLAPGKYLILATSLRPDHTVERMARLWGSRSRAKMVEIPPNGSVQVTVEPAY